ncbi:MAG: rRNA maturation RNase YbeY [Pseudomonadota bacterium]
MDIEVNIEDPRWEDAEIGALAERACAATFAYLELGADWSISILACDDARIAGLNETFRAQSKATNVLAWPSAERAAQVRGDRPLPPDPSDPELGDIAISYDTMRRESSAAGIPLDDHCLHLICHALLHCLGYDHIDDKDAAIMEATEVEVLATLGVADPY